MNRVPFFRKKKIEKVQFFYFSLSIFFIAIFVAGIWNIYSSFAAGTPSHLICNPGETRVISAGTFTDETGSEFNAAAALQLSTSGGACTFELTQSQSDSSISLTSLTVDADVTLTHATSTASAATYNKIDLYISGAVTVNGSIDVSGKGYLGGRQPGNTETDEGLGYGNQAGAFGSDANDGGSHGGRGGHDSASDVPVVYDSILHPTLPGAGGGASDATPGNEGGNGGGVIHIVALNLLGTGSLKANGSDSAAGSGAGGTIYVDVNGGSITGVNIAANGGNTNASGAGAGAGGRVVLRGYTSLTSSYQVHGGTSSVPLSASGAAGTTYLMSDLTTYGILSINNNTIGTASYATELPDTPDEADIVAEYNALVFDSVTVSSYGLLDIPAALDSSYGLVDFNRKIYITSCPADNDTLSNGEILGNYNSASGGENADYSCRAPERVLKFETATSTQSESVASGTVKVILQGPANIEISTDVIVYKVSTTASSGGVDYSTSTVNLVIPANESSSTYYFTVVDDAFVESSEDISFELANPADAVLQPDQFFTYTIVDNDVLGISVALTSENATTSEAGNYATFTVVLDTEPSNPVTINLESSDTSEGTVSSSSLEFSADNWSTPQEITVIGADDESIDGTVDYYVSFSVTSSDLDYNGFTVPNFDLHNADDDSPSNNSISEGPTPLPEDSTSTPRHGGGAGVIQHPNVDAFGNPLYWFTIEDGNALTSSDTVKLSFFGREIESIAVSNFEDFRDEAYFPFVTTTQFQLLAGLGLKTVYARVQTKSGVIYTIFDTIQLVDKNASVDCTLEAEKPYKTLDSSKVYMIHRYTDGENTYRCTKEYLGSPSYFFSYFSSWGDVQTVDASILNTVPDDAFAAPVLGPRFIPYNGSIVKAKESPQVYYIINGLKYLIEDEAALRHMGFDPRGIQTVNTEVLNSFKEAEHLAASSHWPVGLVIRFKNIPARAYQVIATTEDNKVQVKDLGLIEKLDDRVYRRDRIVELEKNKNVLLPRQENLVQNPINRFLTIGSIGNDVRSLQSKLQNLGYFTYESTTGIYGYETARAVERFQKDHSIDSRGYVGPATRSLINSL